MISLKRKKSVLALATHYGDYALDYERFFYENRVLLAEKKIAYPWLSASQSDFPWQSQIITKTKDLLRGDKNACLDLADELRGMDSILLAAPLGPLSGTVPDLLEFFRASPDFAEWATPDVRVVWLARERSSEIEGAALFNLPRDTTGDLFMNCMKNVQVYLDHLRRFLNSGSSVSIFPDFYEDHLSVNKILEALDVVLPESQCIPLRQTPVAPREMLYTLAKLRQAYPKIAFRNLGFSANIQGASSFTMMPPYQLERIYKTTSVEMEKIAKAHGVDLVFATAKAQPGWQPFRPPSPDFCEVLYEEGLGQEPPAIQDLELRILQNSWDADWLAADPAALAGKLREKFAVPVPTEPLLCVLTMAKNQEKYIGECIESVLAQKTDFPVRHIVLDDCSRDDTPKIIRKYAEKYPTIYPIFLRDARKDGDNVRVLFSACHSKYAALCDGDDFFIDPHKLQKQIDFLEAHPDCALCFHPVQTRYEDGSPAEIYPPKSFLPGEGKRHIFTLRDLLKVNIIQTNSVVYRWRFASGLPEWFDATLTPSDWYWHLLHAEMGKIGFIPEVLSTYRRHATSLFRLAFSHRVAHRKQYGMAELETYHSVNEHFHNRYFFPLAKLAQGVFTDFRDVAVGQGDTSLLDEAYMKYPKFAKYFCWTLRIKNIRRFLRRFRDKLWGNPNI